MCEVNIDERELNYTLIWGGDCSHFSATGNWVLETLDCFIVYEVETSLWRNYEHRHAHLVQGFVDGFPKRRGKDGKEQNSHQPSWHPQTHQLSFMNKDQCQWGCKNKELYSLWLMKVLEWMALIAMMYHVP